MPSLVPLLDVLHSVAALSVIALSAFALGRPLVRRLAIFEHDPLALAVWSLALGSWLAGSILFALAWAGWIYELPIALLSLAACLWGLAELVCLYLGRQRWPARGARTDRAAGSRVAARIALALGAAVLVTSFVAALAPTTSPEALSRSLEAPKNVLLAHGLDRAGHESPAPTNLVQMWFLWALVLDGPVAANLVEWSLGCLLALAAVLLARGLVERRTAWLAALLVVLCPGVQRQMSVPLEDLALGLFTTLALTALWQVLSRRGPASWTTAAGCMLGASMAAHPLGIAFAVAVAILWTQACWSARAWRHDLPRASVSLALAAILAGGPWLLAAVGSPGAGPAQSVRSALVHVGPVLLTALAALAVLGRPSRVNLIVGVLAAYAVLAILLPWPLRWWSPIVGPLAAGAAWSWGQADRLPRAARVVALVALGAVVCGGLAGSCRTAGESLAVATGCQQRRDFLLTREPTYRAASLVNRIVAPEQRLLCQDARAFYFACLTACESDVRGPRPLVPAADREADLIACARSGGFSYVLLAEPVANASVEASRAGAAPAGSTPRTGLANGRRPIGKIIPILEYRFADDNNRSIRYRLLRIR